VGMVKEEADFDKILSLQMKRLDVDYIDYYLFHGIGDGGLADIRKLGLFKKMEDAKKAGKIGHICFSFHDSAEAFVRVVDSYDKWDSCQIQYNYMDTQNQAGTTGLKYAASKGIPVIIMEPLLGGRLARAPKDIAAMFPAGRTAAEWAFQWIWNHPEVSTILSGMSDFKQVEENLKSAGRSAANSMKENELAMIERVKAEFEKRTPIPCTQCKYCMPCPHGVNIPRNLELYNEGKKYNDPGSPRYFYNNWFKAEEKADKCTQCKECEEKCPQKIGISSWMPKVDAIMAKGQDYPG
jgi:uncharacterized protein